MNDKFEMSTSEWFLSDEQSADMSEYEITELLLECSGGHLKANEAARELYDKFGSLDGILNADFEDLTTVKGVSEHTATFLKLQYSLLRHYNKQKISKKPSGDVQKSEETINLFMPVFAKLNKEQMYMISINSQGKPKKPRNLADGTADCVVMPLRVIIDAAVRDEAAEVFLAHNHPNGNVYPSVEDIDFTMHVKEQLSRIGVKLSEHYVICDDKYYPILKAASISKK